ncbi:MAG TPA: hypothetical protein ENN19_03645 [Chloroflexi bacterium]|mgnify:CR=1 FL=1|nr:hypothetical protein [Chloroflexota bacterium]
MKTLSSDKIQPKSRSLPDDNELAHLFRIMMTTAMPERPTSPIQEPVNPRKALYKAVDNLDDRDCLMLCRVAEILMLTPLDPQIRTSTKQ